jgi:hypothetical protein
MHPADLDGAMHFSSFASPMNASSPAVPFAIDYAQIEGGAGKMWTGFYSAEHYTVSVVVGQLGGQRPAAFLKNLKARQLSRTQIDVASALEPFPTLEMPAAYLMGADPSFELHTFHHGFFEHEHSTLDVDRLIGAWQVAYRRHAALRVTFLEDGRSQIQDDMEPSIEVRDLTTASRSQAASYLQVMRDQWMHADSPGSPYVRMWVVLLPDGRQHVFHHVSLV